MSHLRNILFVLSLLLIFPLHSYAGDDDSLYAPPAPDGSSFFRFVLADPGAENVKPQAESKSYSTLAFKDVSPYYVIPEGEIRFSANALETSSNLVSGFYYSIIIHDGGLYVLEDQKIENVRKSLISLYNLTDKNSLTLQTTDKGIPVIESVDIGKNGAREINALKVELDVTSADQSVQQSLEPVILERSQAFSIFAFQNKGGEVALKTVKAETDTTQ